MFAISRVISTGKHGDLVCQTHNRPLIGSQFTNIYLNLQIAEIVLGSACVILGVVALFFPFFYFTFVFSIGEGIWCGVWVSGDFVFIIIIMIYEGFFYRL